MPSLTLPSSDHVPFPAGKARGCPQVPPGSLARWCHRLLEAQSLFPAPSPSQGLSPTLGSCRRAQGIKPQTSNRFSPVPPDIGRVGSSQEECGARIRLVEDGEVHDICQVVGNSLQVHPPAVAALHLHQVGEEELSQLWELPQKGIMRSSVRATSPQDVPAPSVLLSTRFCPSPMLSHSLSPLQPWGDVLQR